MVTTFPGVLVGILTKVVERGEQRLREEECTWEHHWCTVLWSGPQRDELDGGLVWSSGPKTFTFLPAWASWDRKFWRKCCSRRLLLPGVIQKDPSVEGHSVRNTQLERCTGKKRGSSGSPVLRNGERAEIKPGSIEHLVQIKSELDASGPPYFW